MFLNETQPRKNFKRLLGNANHFLITILVGLNGVETGKVTKDAEFDAAWNPKDVKSSARRSRAFALDLALLRAIDALDAYMSWCYRKPALIQAAGFRSEMDGAGQKVAWKFKTFCDNLPVLDPFHAALIRAAIAWRNRRIHSLAENEIPAEDRQLLHGNAAALSRDFRGLMVDVFLSRFDEASPPSFKEAASIISAVQKAVQAFDRKLIEDLNVECYLKDLILSELSRGCPADRNIDGHLMQRAGKIWAGDSEERRRRVHRYVELLGFSADDKYEYNQSLPLEFVQQLYTADPDTALSIIRSP